MKKYSDPTVHKEQYHLQRVLVFNGSECFRCPRQLYKVSFHTVKSFSYNSHVIHLQGGFFSWWVKALTGIIWFSLNNFKFKVGYLNGDKECNVQQNTRIPWESCWSQRRAPQQNRCCLTADWPSSTGLKKTMKHGDYCSTLFVQLNTCKVNFLQQITWRVKLHLYVLS